MFELQMRLLPGGGQQAVTSLTANGSVFISRGKEFGHDVDIIFTTLQLGMEENLLLAVIKSLEKQVWLHFQPALNLESLTSWPKVDSRSNFVRSHLSSSPLMRKGQQPGCSGAPWCPSEESASPNLGPAPTFDLCDQTFSHNLRHVLDSRSASSHQSHLTARTMNNNGT